MDVLLAELEGYWGLIVIIAYLLGMGTPYPWRHSDRETHSKHLDETREQVNKLFDMVTYMLTHDKPAEPPEDKGSSGGSS